MLTDLKQEARKYGLQIHPDKTQILSNVSQRQGRNAKKTVDIDGEEVSIIPLDANTKYLGRSLSLGEYDKTEFNNRISSAWRKFNMLRHELTSKNYPLRSRMQLFNATLTPTVMYGSEAWTLTKDMTTTLKRTQRRMLRLIINTPRRRQQTRNPHNDNTSSSNETDSSTSDEVKSNPSNTDELKDLVHLTEDECNEPWQDFIKRATQTAEHLATKFNVCDWSELYHRKKWRWAERVANQSQDRWSRIMSSWEPLLHDNRPCKRHNYRPRKRWDDAIRAFLQTTPTPKRHWIDIATDTTLWTQKEDDYVAFATQYDNNSRTSNNERSNNHNPIDDNNE